VKPEKKSLKSVIFVLVQFASLAAIALTGPLLADNMLLLALEMTGIALGIWAVIVMKPGNFNIIPDPPPSSKLVNSGPYRFIRHPMYLALLMTTLPLVLDSFSLVRLSFWLILMINLILKMDYEERLLVDGVENYDSYLGKSHRILPFIY
jgi:protein-S-isoprenylcysteine O-methyltransferase Ste14